MTRLQSLRVLAESYANSYGSTQVGAMCFFMKYTENMYPLNEHRREWALANLLMFYEAELERHKILETSNV